MLIVRNKIFPFCGYKAINLFGILFCKKDAVIGSVDINHERIHTKQMTELLFIPYYIWYGVEYLIRLLRYWNPRKAYKNICFEREAYVNENNMEYLKSRRIYSWIK